MSHAHVDETKIKFSFTGKLKAVSLGLIVIGLVLTALHFVFPWHPTASEAHGNPRFFASILLALTVALPLALGGLYFIAFNYVAGAAWNVTIRRIAENYIWFMPVVLVLMGIVFFGLNDLYHHWTHYEAGKDHLLDVKRPWLNEPFFIIRNIAWVIVWAIFGFIFYKHSTDQDKTGALSHSKKIAFLAPIFLVIFALSYSANSWDLTMSLDPHWFSTMWAPYAWSGLALTAFSSIIMWVWYLKNTGYYGDALNENHYHDLGKYMWGHSIFWAYIAVSQFLLIWYAHIPEETTFYYIRSSNGWKAITVLMVLVRFILPFFLIIKREWKRNINHLGAVAVVVFIGQIIDMYWVIYPTIDGGQFVMFNHYELGPLLLVAGLFIFITGKMLERNALIPVKDPRLEECLHWHQ